MLLPHLIEAGPFWCPVRLLDRKLSSGAPTMKFVVSSTAPCSKNTSNRRSSRPRTPLNTVKMPPPR